MVKSNKKIYYSVRLKGEKEYKEGILNYQAYTSVEMAECLFITLNYDVIKGEIAKQYGKTANDIEAFQIDKMEALK